MENGEAAENCDVCLTGTANGGEDVCICKESDASSADHLVVFVHGILGRASDWKFGAEQFVMRLPDKVFIHCFRHILESCGISKKKSHTSLSIPRRTSPSKNWNCHGNFYAFATQELLNGLSRVPWEKVDVSFNNSKFRFAAHSVIQVKEHYMHSEGADVIQHMVDHFGL